MSEAEATAMREDMVEATVVLNSCAKRLYPPAMKQQPRTSKMLDRMLPSILAWTIRISPWRSATTETCASSLLAMLVNETRSREDVQ